jgi:hypothetical protein
MSQHYYRDWTCKLWKNGAEVGARFRGPKVFRRAKTYELLPRDRVFAVDTESLSSQGKLTTVLTPIHFHDRGVMVETREGRGMLHELFAAVFARDGYLVKEEQPAYTKQRERRTRTTGADWRDGDRQSLDPVLSVWFNMPYDFGRLASDVPYILRSVAAGAPSYRIRISDRFELEVRRMHFGSAASFDWRIRDVQAKSIVRMLGLDLTGYWKTSLAKAARSLGVAEKIDIESQIEGVYEKVLESFTPEEWHLFKLYGLGDVQTTLELYHRTAELLTRIDPRVVRQTGVIPASAPGASAKIVFAKAFDCHPDRESWERYPTWADQMGARSYFGGRAFCRRSGVFRRMKTLDLKSAYPFQMALLPDPVTVRMCREHATRIDSSEAFLRAYRGRYGVLCVSGEGLDDEMPAFRAHDKENHGRLRYVAGPFQKQWVTIPELVIGVVRGALRIDVVHDGVTTNGSSESSFLRAGVKDFFAIKEDKSNEQALRDLAKLLANSLYGKLIEVVLQDYLIAERNPCLRFTEHARICEGIATLFASGGESDDFDALYWGESPEQIAKAQSFFRAVKVERLPHDKRGPEAVTAYVEALEFAGAPHEPGSYVSVAEFVRSHKAYKAGQFFMPLYASQVTGATSAMVGLMAHCLDAYQGDTDSVHCPLPEGAESLTELPGFARYFDLMAEAGYPSARKVNGVTVHGAAGIDSLGTWEEETPEPSIESLLVRPKVYSHAFAKPFKGGSKHKQAKHGFARFHTPAVDAKRREGSPIDLLGEGPTIPLEERAARGFRVSEGELHEAMRTLLLSGAYAYDARKAPRKLREAIRSGLPVGEFVPRAMRMTLAPDPNTWKDEHGFIHWAPAVRLEGAETRPARKGAKGT